MFLPLILSFLPPFSVDALKADPRVQRFDTSFVLMELETKQMVRFNPQRATTRFAPCSTFKIFNTLVGLETGVLENYTTSFPWDGTEHRVKAWNRHHTLRTAFRDSVVWYYQDLARRIGFETMQRHILKNTYGNQDASGGIDQFWLGSTLEISAEEQVQFLARLLQGKATFRSDAIDVVRSLMIQEQHHGVTLGGKTGSGYLEGGLGLGWFVGYLDVGNKHYVFALNIVGEGASGFKARDIVKDHFRAMSMLPK